MNRLKLTWMHFTVLLSVTILYWTVYVLNVTATASLDPSDHRSSHLVMVINNVGTVVTYAYAFFVMFVLFVLRSTVRSKYGIRASKMSNADLDDCCIVFIVPFGTGLVASQLLRHTADYDAYPARLCSSTGLSTGAPSIV
jgi:hypothetical protein